MFDMIFRDLQQTYIGWPLAWMWMTPGANGKRGVDQIMLIVAIMTVYSRGYRDVNS